MRQVLQELCVYDYYDVNASIVLLSTELGLHSKLTSSLARPKQYQQLCSRSSQLLKHV